MLAQIVQMVADAQRSRAPIQRLADQVAGWFVPAVIVAAIAAFTAWAVFGPEPRMAFGLVAAVSVLIIACPCALGLATPMSIMLDAAVKALSQILSPPMRSILWRSIGFALVLITVLAIGLQRLLSWFATYGEGWAEMALGPNFHTPLHLLSWVLSIAAGLGVVLGGIFLMPAVTSLVASVFVDDVAEHVEHDIGGLAPGAGQRLDLGPRARHLAAEFGDQLFRQRNDVLRLVAIEPNGLDVFAHFLFAELKHLLRRIGHRKQRARRLVDAGIRCLRREHDRDQQRIGVEMFELALRLRIGFAKPAERLMNFSAQFLACWISLTIASAAAFGSAASITGRPTTR